ncbi:MAG: methyltransferase domain-containing protein [Myxococcota bacterium]
MAERRQGDADYVLGTSGQEKERLRSQGDAIGPITERLLVQAGIGPGMRVLDIGCGSGDVAMIVARLVGAEGKVVGTDRKPRMLAAARERARSLALSTLSFVEGDFREFGSRQDLFDAAVGRLVLMYQADAVDAVRRLANSVQPGGLIVSREYDSTLPPASLDPFPLHEQVRRWIWATLERSGADIHMGFQLYSVLKEAGLLAPQVRAEAIVQTPTTRYPTVPLVRVLLPRMVEYGIATEKEVDVESLEERLLEECQNGKDTYVGQIVFGAWAHRRR